MSQNFSQHPLIAGRRKEMPKEISMPKRQSDARWSANAEAVKAVLIGYNYVLASLTKLESESTQKSETKTAAKNLANSLKLLETRILLHVWNEILQPIDRVNKQLQSSKIDLSTAVNLLQSLEIVLEEMREKYDEYEKKAFNMVEMNEYRLEQNRNRKRKKSDSIAETYSPKDIFRINIFNVVIDKLKVSLKNRIKNYDDIFQVFSIFSNFSCEMSETDVREGVTRLCEKYSTDFPDDFTMEFMQFLRFVKNSKIKQKDEESLCMWLFRVIVEAKVVESFPNVETSLKIYLSLMITNCSGECSFSLLKRVKNCLRSTMSEENLCALALLSIESTIVKSLDIDIIINDFASTKARKQNF